MRRNLDKLSFPPLLLYTGCQFVFLTYFEKQSRQLFENLIFQLNQEWDYDLDRTQG